MKKLKYIICALFLLLSIVSQAQEVESLLVHPIFNKRYSCSEHALGELSTLGDALGADCVIYELRKDQDRTWLKAYNRNGSKNSDWFGWQKDVLAPVEGQVFKINVNSTSNEPGIMGKGSASFMIIKGKNGVMVLLAHVDKIVVKEGDSVKAGQIIAKVGNNGQSRHPHIHIGAWKDKTPLQIRFDQRKIHFD